MVLPLKGLSLYIYSLLHGIPKGMLASSDDNIICIN